MDLAGTLALTGVLLATLTDWKTRKVPNWLTVPMAAAGMVLGIWFSGFLGFVGALSGAALGLLLFIYPFSMGWMGGGDVKLIMAVGALLGTQQVFHATLYGAVAGGVGALTLVTYRMVRAGEFLAQLRLSFVALGLWLTQLSTHTTHRGPEQTLPATKAALREKFPYAFAIAVGTFITLWQGRS